MQSRLPDVQWPKVSGPDALDSLDRHWMRYLRVALIAAAVLIMWRLLAWQEDGYFTAAVAQLPTVAVEAARVPLLPSEPPRVDTAVAVMVISPTPTPTATPSPTPAPTPTPTPITYTVRFGDTLSEIAMVYEVSVAELLAINEIDDPNNLAAGQVLTLPADAVFDPDRALPSTYVVQAGDTLSAIAVALGVTMGDLKDANNITDPDSILVGQELVVPGGGL